MTAVVKALEGGFAIASLSASAPIPQHGPVIDPKIAELESEIERLEQLVATRRQETEMATADARRAGYREAVADDAARLERVQRGVEAAIAAWRDEMAELDGLAASLSITVLEKIFGADTDRAADVRNAVRHHITQLQDRTQVHVRVSQIDFSDAEAIDSLAIYGNVASTRLTADPNLGSGECRVTLQLGERDLSPASQWAILRDVLISGAKSQ